MAEDYYATLGVSKTASHDDIQKAYRAKARKLHPDMNPDDPNAKKNFQKLQEAFEVLSNTEKRKMYDQFGSAYFTQGGSPQGNPFQWSGGGSPFGQSWSGHGGPQQGGSGQANFNLDDILRMFGGGGGGAASGAERAGFGDAEGLGSHPFSQFFNMGAAPEGAGGAYSTGTGRRRRSSQPQEKTKGTDITHTLTIPFVTAVLGGKSAISIRRPKQSGPETVSFSIPVGVEDGKKIRLRGLGNPSPNGGDPGDIIITVNVDNHHQFKRNGRNLSLVVPITLQEAVLGAKIDVPSPHGMVSVTVPPGSTSGMKLRVKGCGVPLAPIKNNEKTAETGTADQSVTKEAGDLIAELSIQLPRSWSQKDLELIKQLAPQSGAAVRHNLKWES